ncbi:hypothetical protein LJC68_08305 [Bacteroidales bacterium OttesenSCG-928-B11]|nr:hypothetical protein [Bacteroidales bacterium OttesenSCG-928-C03]MDL2312862.1 hypothetical protein [Bacteroidales bacterium OttesenSCG-928-B11]MDL2325864.1 hypothetical protein [Bacteroidales bacterium OttesenSCG-928-A14]
MSDFDQFIKNLGESEMPEYRAEYWKQFSQKAGFGSNIAKGVLLSSISAVIVGVAIWGGIHFLGNTSDTPELQPSATPETEIAIPKIDTTEQAIPEPVFEEIIEQPVENLPSQPVAPITQTEKKPAKLAKPIAKPTAQPSIDPTPQISQPEESKPIKEIPQEEPKPRRNRESFYFDPDTITYP